MLACTWKAHSQVSSKWAALTLSTLDTNVEAVLILHSIVKLKGCWNAPCDILSNVGMALGLFLHLYIIAHLPEYLLFCKVSGCVSIGWRPPSSVVKLHYVTSFTSKQQQWKKDSKQRNVKCPTDECSNEITQRTILFISNTTFLE